MKKYKVILPIFVGEATHYPGSVIELDPETAKLYAHALIAVEEEEAHAH